MYKVLLRPKSGFTLIEILVVVSIIGILSAVLYASFNEARQQSRNKIMRSTIAEVQLALELYKSQNGYYPRAGSTPSCVSGTTQTTSIFGTTPLFCPSNSTYIIGLAPDFLPVLPAYNELSRNTTCSVQYTVDNNTNPTWYKLVFSECLEGIDNQAAGVQDTDEFARCPSQCANTGQCARSSARYYRSLAIYSTGAECIGE